MTAYALCQLRHACDHAILAINTNDIEHNDRVVLQHVIVALGSTIGRNIEDRKFAVVIPRYPSTHGPFMKYQNDVTPEDRTGNEVLENLEFNDAFNATFV